MGGMLVFSQDEPLKRRLAQLMRAEGIDLHETSSALEAIHIIKNEDIALVLSDQSLGGDELTEFNDLIKKTKPSTNVLFIGGFTEGGRNISLNPDGFRRYLLDSIRKEKSLSGDIDALKQSFFSFAERLIQVFEVNNRYFYNNDRSVADLASRIAYRMGLDDNLVESIRMAALLKDLGKVGIQQQLIDDKKRLSDEELIPIKKHTLNTVQILKQIRFPWDIESIVLQHHEQYDGSGYPFGLKGRQISIGARIIAIADSYVAMTTDRPYREALSREDAMREIMKKTGTQFDPEVAEVFMSVMRDEPSEPKAKKTVLILERQPAVTALVKLSVAPEGADVTQVASSIDAIRFVRQGPPDLIVADVEIFDPAAFLKFHSTLRGIPSVREKPFLFVIPNKDYPKDFKGENNHYITKPVDIREMALSMNSLLEEHAAPLMKSSEMRGLSGSIEDFNLADLIQILNLGLKTAKVEIHHNKETGIIYIQHGKVAHASAGGQKGKDAFLELMRWDRGTFRILHGLTTDDVNITVDTMYLLLEAARVIDEKGRQAYSYE